MTGIVEHGYPGRGQQAAHACHPIALAQAFHIALLEVLYRGQRPRSHCRRQGRGEDEARRVGADEIAQRLRGGNITAQHAEGLAERALDHRQTMGQALALTDATAVRTIEANRVNLVDVGHGAMGLGDVADLGDRCDVTVHGIDGLEGDQFGLARVSIAKLAVQILRAVVGPEHLFRAAVADALDHRGVVGAIGKDDAVRNARSQSAQGCPVGDIARSEE